MAKVEDGKLKWEEDDVCGVGIFATSTEDPFLWACRWHDLSYQAQKQSSTKTRQEIDREFLDKMLSIARRKQSKLLAAKAYLYYSLARALGWRPWSQKDNAI